jgi:hypothetical protein
MYKKLLLVFVSIIAIQTAKAQTEKGAQSLGLSFGVSTQSSDTKSFNYSDNTYGPITHGKATSYFIAPNYSYFIADKLDIGVSAGYNNSKQISDNNQYSPQNYSQNSFSGSVYLRKYFLYNNKIGIRTGPQFTYQRSNTKQEFSYNPTIISDTHNNVYTGGIGLDFVCFPLKQLGLTARLGGAYYSHQKSTGSTEGTYNDFSLSFANVLNLSVNYNF